MTLQEAESHGVQSNQVIDETGGNYNESTSVSKADLREVQDHTEKRKDHGYL